MRKLIESTLVSLDGVIEAPERWASFDDEAAALSFEQLGSYDAFIMGRVTYETFYATWGHTTGNPYAPYRKTRAAERAWSARLATSTARTEPPRWVLSPASDRRTQKARPLSGSRTRRVTSTPFALA